MGIACIVGAACAATTNSLEQNKFINISQYCHLQSNGKYFSDKIEAIKYMQDEIKGLLNIKQFIYEEDAKYFNKQIDYYQNKIKELILEYNVDFIYYRGKE